MKCKPPYFVAPFSSWNDDRLLALIFSGMNWRGSAGKKIPLGGLHSLTSGNNWNVWCYTIVLIWIWLTETIVTHHVMTLSVTKKRNWKVLCNLDVNLYVWFFDVMTCPTMLTLRSKSRFIPRREVREIFFSGHSALSNSHFSIEITLNLRHLGSAILERTSLARGQEHDNRV